jgi:hypothetical protein
MERHRRRFGAHIRVQVLFRGNKKECLNLEWRLRPRAEIGWNKHPGGSMHRLGAKMSPESRKKMSEAGKRRPPITEETREKQRIRMLGTTNRGRIGQQKSEKEKAKIAAAHTGMKASAETLRKQSARMIGTQLHLGYTHSAETKERIRLQKIGVPVHSEEHKQKLSERWKGNSLTKGRPWSAARRLRWLTKSAR